jgi:uncharacterized Zn-finger protein
METPEMDQDIPYPVSAYDDSIIFPDIDVGSAISYISAPYFSTIPHYIPAGPPVPARPTKAVTELQMQKHIETAVFLASQLGIAPPTFMRNPRDNRFYCSICDKSFRSCSDLISHFRIHTNERPHICEKCNTSFSHISNLRAHERSIHGILTRRYAVANKIPVGRKRPRQ